MSATLGNTAAIEEKLEAYTGRKVSLVCTRRTPGSARLRVARDPLPETVEDLLEQRPRADLRRELHAARGRGGRVGADQCEGGKSRDASAHRRGCTRDFRFDTPFGKRDEAHRVARCRAASRRAVAEISSARRATRTTGPAARDLGHGHARRRREHSDPIGAVHQAQQVRRREGARRCRRAISSRSPGAPGGKRLRRARERDLSGAGVPDRSQGRRGQAPRPAERARRSSTKRAGRRPASSAGRRSTFEQLVRRQPEALVSGFRISHGMMVAVLQRSRAEVGKRGGYGALVQLVARTHETPNRRRRIVRDMAVLFRALRRAGIVHVANHEARVDPDLQRGFLAAPDALALFRRRDLRARPRRSRLPAPGDRRRRSRDREPERDPPTTAEGREDRADGAVEGGPRFLRGADREARSSLRCPLPRQTSSTRRSGYSPSTTHG